MGGTTSLDVDTRVETTETTNMADSKDTRGRITTNFARLLAVGVDDRIILRQTTTIDVRGEKIDTVATMDMETNTTPRQEGVMEGIEAEVGEVDVVTMTIT